MSFNYDDSPDVDDETVRSVVADISGSGKPPPLSDEEREQRQLEHERFVAESRQRDRQQRLQYERQRAEAEALRRAEAERQAAIARHEANAKLLERMAERDRRRSHDRTLTGLLNHAVEQRQYRHGFAKSAQMAASRQRLSKALDNAVATRYPPPPPEPNIVVVQDDGSADFGSRNFDVAKCAKKPRSWF